MTHDVELDAHSLPTAASPRHIECRYFRLFHYCTARRKAPSRQIRRCREMIFQQHRQNFQAYIPTLASCIYRCKNALTSASDAHASIISRADDDDAAASRLRYTAFETYSQKVTVSRIAISLELKQITGLKICILRDFCRAPSFDEKACRARVGAR